MRRAGWLILAAISILVVAVGYTYYGRVNRFRENPNAAPEHLEENEAAKGREWHYRKTDNGRPIAEVSAKSYTMVKEPSHFELEGVELHIFHKDGKTFDQIKTTKAQYDTADGIMYSDGDVEIIMGMEEDVEPTGRLMKINSSGVRLDSRTGKATTDRPATFAFDRGDGKCIGAEYDPQIRELKLLRAVELSWKGKDGKATPMHVEAGDATYYERDSKVFLGQFSKLKREALTMDAGPAVVTLDQGIIQLVETEKAKGVQDNPGRKVEFAGDQLVMHFNEKGVVQQLTATGNAKVNSATAAANTTVTSNRLDLDFEAGDKESVLKTALATGAARVDARPVPRPNVQQAETRILRSESLFLTMRAGGQEIDNVETRAPGELEFLPNRQEQPKRALKGDRIWIAYGENNAIQSFKSVNVSTRTDNPPKGKPPKPAPPVLTWSQSLTAQFDAKGSQLTQMEQVGDFRYEEGVRKARAQKAVLEQASNVMTLDGAARVWDDTGSTTADRIQMNQKTSDVVAEGNVSSMRMPDRKGSSSAMLDKDQPMQGKANKMTTADSNLQIHYEGNAVVWQGPNRIQADRIDIDRDNEALKAAGHVISTFVDRQKPPKESKNDTKKDADKKEASAKPATPAAPVFTVVRAPELTYTDEDRMAYYKGGVILNKPGMNVKSRELKAFLNESDADNSVDKAFADGAVEIVQTTPKRTRTGTGEHAEYYVKEEKVILEGGQPLMVDSLKGNTRGKQLTYFANSDKLLVNGVESQRATSTILRNKK